MSSRKDLRALLRAAEAAGATVSRTRSSHLRVSNGRGVIVCSSTPSDVRAVRSVRRDLRKHLGIDL